MPKPNKKSEEDMTVEIDENIISIIRDEIRRAKSNLLSKTNISLLRNNTSSTENQTAKPLETVPSFYSNLRYLNRPSTSSLNRFYNRNMYYDDIWRYSAEARGANNQSLLKKKSNDKQSKPTKDIPHTITSSDLRNTKRANNSQIKKKPILTDYITTGLRNLPLNARSTQILKESKRIINEYMKLINLSESRNNKKDYGTSFENFDWNFDSEMDCDAPLDLTMKKNDKAVEKPTDYSMKIADNNRTAQKRKKQVQFGENSYYSSGGIPECMGVPPKKMHFNDTLMSEMKQFFSNYSRPSTSKCQDIPVGGNLNVLPDFGYLAFLTDLEKHGQIKFQTSPPKTVSKRQPKQDFVKFNVAADVHPAPDKIISTANKPNVKSKEKTHASQQQQNFDVIQSLPWSDPSMPILDEEFEPDPTTRRYSS